ncbi:MAG: hypothetical protein JRJ84_03710 [Deltaproteobacteria bacterium]|nr:hypothetical protein [Deltaproteobacteria bacterium]
MTVVLPPGPFPPQGAESADTVDLAVRLLEERFTRGWIEGSGRSALSGQLRDTLGRRSLAEAGAVLVDFLDTWPVAALVDGARVAWSEGPDGGALTVLARAAELVRRASGWDTLGDTPWPLPDDDWIRNRAGSGPCEAHKRADRDGAEAVGTALGLAVEKGDPVPLPPTEEVAGSELVRSRAALSRKLTEGQIFAVRVVGDVPPEPAYQLALGEIRLEGRAQRPFERFGPMGLLVGDAPAWVDLLEPAPAGTPGETLHTTCLWGTFPGTPRSLARGQLKPVAFLMWDGPHTPLPIDASTLPLLGAFGQGASTAQVATTLGQLEEGIRPVVRELIALGALSA